MADPRLKEDQPNLTGLAPTVCREDLKKGSANRLQRGMGRPPGSAGGRQNTGSFWWGAGDTALQANR